MNRIYIYISAIGKSPVTIGTFVDPLVKSEFFGFKKSPGTWYTLQSDMIQKICLNTQHSEDVQNTSAEILQDPSSFTCLAKK